MPFESLLKRITPTLKRVTNKLNGYCQFVSEEDLLQEALMHLWTNFKDGKLRDKNDSYILQGCYFHCRNYLRKNQCRADKEICFLKDLTYSDNSLPAKLAVEALFRENILSKREKEVLSLLSEGLTITEIGKRLKISHVRVIGLKKQIRNKFENFF